MRYVTVEEARHTDIFGGVDIDAIHYRRGAVAPNPSSETRRRRAAWKDAEGHTRAGIDRAVETTSRGQSAGRGHAGEGPLRAIPQVPEGRPQPSSPIRGLDAVRSEAGTRGNSGAVGTPETPLGKSARQRIEELREQRALEAL